MLSLYNFLADKNGNVWIAWVTLYLLIVSCVILRINIEATGYITPDSFYYLEAAENILKGIGPYGPKVFDVDPVNGRLIPLFDPALFGHPEEYTLTFFSVWPLGYPVCIAGIAYITGTSVFWASKIVNLLFLAFSFYLLYKYFKHTGLLTALYFCSYPILEIVSYSWSEMGFLSFLLLLVISIDKISEAEITISRKYYAFVALALSFMFLFRYAGIIFYLLTGLVILYQILEKEYRKAILLGLALSLAFIVSCIYLWMNYRNVGFITGMPRAATQELSVTYLIQRLAIGLFNQIHLIKQFRFSSQSDFYFYLLLALFQLSLFLFWKDLKGLHFWKSYFVKVCLTGALIYLCFLIYLTFTSTIDPFDYRTLSPFSHLIYIALFTSLGTHLIRRNAIYAYLYFISFFIISLIMNLPKHFLIEWFTGK